MKFSILILSLTAGLLLTGCGGNRASQNQEAVEKGIMEYLQNRAGLDIKAMDVTVANVAFRENEADATVTFRAKGTTDAGNMMQVKYVLEQKDGKWAVKGRSGSGGHGADGAGGGGGMMPPGHPPAGKKE